MFWDDDEFEAISILKRHYVPDILISLAEGYRIPREDVDKIIRKTDEKAEKLAKEQKEVYKSPLEEIIKKDIKEIREIGDGFHRVGAYVKFSDGDTQKVYTDDLTADLDTSVLLCVIKHIAKINGDENGTHALNRIMFAIKKKRAKCTTNTIADNRTKTLTKAKKAMELENKAKKSLELEDKENTEYGREQSARND